METVQKAKAGNFRYAGWVKQWYKGKYRIASQILYVLGKKKPFLFVKDVYGGPANRRELCEIKEKH